ncbi:hypothetical protein A0H81_08425 [Grifola frondosa]|uniref:Uncharacterized protein n=1 Tax=Grifola frondosa TaxID=5627 RepID=A0A1C7M469_GRIFR|nr:hypothetical protein A0H81_08425 [Grifola frondosa]
MSMQLLDSCSLPSVTKESDISEVFTFKGSANSDPLQATGAAAPPVECISVPRTMHPPQLQLGLSAWT